METKHLERVVIRFAGDSGDGMQLTGTEFAKAAAEAGNDISTFPDFPAEIRAPAGSLFGVSGFQLHFSSSEIYTPGDAPDVIARLVASVDRAFGLWSRRQVFAADDQPGAAERHSLLRLARENARAIDYRDSGAQVIRAVRIGAAAVS